MKTFILSLAAVGLVSLCQTAFCEPEKQEAQELSAEHGVRSIGFLFESDLGEESFNEVLQATKGKVLNLKEVKADGEKLTTSAARLITLQPKTVAGKKAIEVKIRTFTGLPASKEKTQELLKLAEKTEPFKSAEEYKKETESEASAGKVYETYSATDPNAPERCFSAPNGALSMRDIYGRDFAGTSYQCNDWIRRVERAYNIYCRRSWQPDRSLSTYGCYCLY